MLFFRIIYFWCRQSVQKSKKKITAELRTINLCDSDLSLSNYNATQRKFSMSSHSYYSGTESQQSIGGRSFYDNVDESKDKFIESSRFLMPPKTSRRHSLVNRSRSFQGTANSHLHSPDVWLRRNFQDSSSVGDSSVDCSENQIPTPDVEYRMSAPPTCSFDKKTNGPFYVKILKQMRKLSHRLRKFKKITRGTST